MKHRFFLWLSLLIAFSCTLQSCRNEDLLLSDKKENQKSMSSKILHYQDLIQHTAAFSELMKITKNDDGSQGSRVYTDEENGFTVDLDDCLFMEDPRGQKSYTFKITEIDPKNNNPDILENLVLVEKGGGIFESYIFQYEKDVQLNYFKSEEDLIQNLKQKVKIFGLGEKRDIEINSKIALCVGVTATYVEQPGTACLSGQHTYEDGSACEYWGTINMALPGYGGHFVYTFDAADCYGGGGGNPSSGSGTTGPYHGGGGGTGTINNPCTKAKAILTNSQVQAKISELKTQSTLGGEKGVKFKTDGTPSSTISGGAHSVNFGDKTGYAGGYHNHTPTGIPMLSPPDIDQLLGFAKAQPTSDPTNVKNAYVGMVAPNGMHYVIWFNGNYQDAITTFSQDQLDSYIIEYQNANDVMLLDSQYSADHLNLNAKGVEALFFETLKKMGLQGKANLQRIESNGTIQNINLDANNNPIATPCP